MTETWKDSFCLAETLSLGGLNPWVLPLQDILPWKLDPAQFPGSETACGSLKLGGISRLWRSPCISPFYLPPCVCIYVFGRATMCVSYYSGYLFLLEGVLVIYVFQGISVSSKLLNLLA